MYRHALESENAPWTNTRIGRSEWAFPVRVIARFTTGSPTRVVGTRRTACGISAARVANDTKRGISDSDLRLAYVDVQPPTVMQHVTSVSRAAGMPCQPSPKLRVAD